jgi:hypothetical protein
MTTCFRDPTLAELLNDPITRAVMRADGVNPRELETRLRDLAARRADSPEHLESTRRWRLQMCGAQ